jgi:hypothetical protein
MLAANWKATVNQMWPTVWNQVGAAGSAMPFKTVLRPQAAAR